MKKRSKLNKIRKAATQYKKLRKEYNRSVDLYWKAVRNKWAGKTKKYEHKSYILRTRMLKAGLKQAKTSGNEDLIETYTVALAKHKHVSRFTYKPGQRFYLRKVSTITKSKYEIVNAHWDEIQQLCEEHNIKTTDLMSDEVWDMLKNTGKVVQSGRNGVWLWKVNEDEYEVISPL